jgi:hypothetical protein
MRQPERGMHNKVIGKVRVTGNVQFKRISFYKMPVHHDAHAAIASWRRNARE